VAAEKPEAMETIKVYSESKAGKTEEAGNHIDG
jgi:hypothetical protein